jgi:hypothetical protein
MKPALVKAPTPTDEQLELALRHLWRPGYPRDLREALNHPTFGHCVRGLARNLGRAQPPAKPPHRLPLAPVPATPSAPPIRRQAARGLDRKRAAANDFDD